MFGMAPCDIRCASQCFPIKKAGRQDFTHTIARPSTNTDNKIGKQREPHGICVLFTFF